MATIQGVYVALFGRPADPAGLAYFNGITNNGANLSSIASLAGTAEYQTRFTGQSNTQIVNSIYQSLFGRDAEAAGLNFFVDALNKGTLNINNIAIAILDGAQGNDKTISANKIAAADLYTKSLDTAAEIGSYTGTAAAAQGRAFITGVTTTVPGQSSVDAAITQMQIAGAAGNTINLAAGAVNTISLTSGVTDVLGNTKTATNNNDTFNATAVLNAAGNATADDSFVFAGANADKIDGGLGIDTLNVTIDTAALSVAADQLKSVEIINVTAALGASGLNVAEAKEATQVWSVAGAAGAQQNLALSGISLNATAGLKGAFAAATNSFAFTDANASSTAKLAVDSATSTGAVTIADVGTVALTNTGTSNISLTTAAAKAYTVAGDGNLTLTATNAVLETVTASSFSGALNFNLSANDALKSYVGGTGADTITIDTVHTNDITINAGAGADSITILGNATTTGVDAAAAPPVTTTQAYVNNASAKAIVLTGGDGADTFTFGTNTATPKVGDTANAANSTAGVVGNITAVDTQANFIKNLITISDFNKAADGIKISDGVTTGGGRQSIVDSDIQNIKTAGNYSTLLAAVTKVASITELNKVALFEYGGDSYIFVNSNTTALDTGDTLVKVTGAALADFTSSNFAVI